MVTAGDSATLPGIPLMLLALMSTAPRDGDGGSTEIPAVVARLPCAGASNVTPVTAIPAEPRHGKSELPRTAAALAEVDDASKSLGKIGAVTVACVETAVAAVGMTAPAEVDRPVDKSTE